MSQPKILNYKNLSFDKLEYLQPHKTIHNTQISTISYRLKANQTLPIYIETPVLKTTSGIIKLENRYYIDFELDITGAPNDFYEFITKFDEKNVMSCHFHSHEWFNQRIPLDVIEDYYKSPIRLQRGGKLPLFRVRIPTHHGKVLAEFYNNKRESIDMTKIEAGDEVICILEFSGLRFLSQQFIAEWELSKLKLMRTIPEQTVIPSGYYFSDVVDPVTTEESVLPVEILESSEQISDQLIDAAANVNPFLEDDSPSHNKVKTPVNEIVNVKVKLEDKEREVTVNEGEGEGDDNNSDVNEYIFDGINDDDVVFEDSEYELDDIDDVEIVEFKDHNMVTTQPSTNSKSKDVVISAVELEKKRQYEEALEKMKEYEELIKKQKDYLESLNLTS
jgi:hypothetical protein